MSNKVHLYDTTLRDGTQREGLSLSLGEEGGLAVRVRDENEVGIPGVEVSWDVSPDSQGLATATSTTNDEGIATNAFVEDRAGEYKISASVAGVDPLVFTVLVGSSVSATPQEAVRAAIFNACPDVENNTVAFQTTCDAVVSADLGETGDAQEAYFALANDEIAAQKRMMEYMMGQQNANVQARLAALRRGILHAPRLRRLERPRTSRGRNQAGDATGGQAGCPGCRQLRGRSTGHAGGAAVEPAGGNAV